MWSAITWVSWKRHYGIKYTSAFRCNVYLSACLGLPSVFVGEVSYSDSVTAVGGDWGALVDPGAFQDAWTLFEEGQTPWADPYG
jgi:hypothetical protein